jgi:nucleoside-diphosphate-sugar epimerase
MRVFITGATGFVGSAVVQELIRAGHQVLGLARSDAGAKALIAAGAEVHRGSLEVPDSIRSGTTTADAVIHTAFNHDFSKFKENSEIERRAIEALGAALAGSDRPFIITSGTALVSPGRVATEDLVSTLTPNDFPRVATDQAVDALAARGVHTTAVRLAPSTHGDGDHGFVPRLISIAREKGVSAFVGDGSNRWPCVHRLDAARLYGLAVEKGSPGARYHAIADEGVPFREIAGVIGRRLNLPVVSKTPEEAATHFGWFARFATVDCPASSQRTRELLGWQPKEPGLIADIDRPRYFAS